MRAALQLPPLGGPTASAALGPAAQERREAPTAQAIRRALSVYTDEWCDALVGELGGGDLGRTRVLMLVIESLGHALRAWIIYGHAPEAIAGYFQSGPNRVEHERAALLVSELSAEYEVQATLPENETQ